MAEDSLHVGNVMDNFDYVIRWLEQERYLYQAGKWEYEGKDVEEVKKFNTTDYPTPHDLEKAYWFQRLDNYLTRCWILGLENSNGRQALAKFATTAVAMLEASVEAYGELPAPGVSSGEINEWEVKNDRS